MMKFRQPGFTMIELVIVILLTAILAISLSSLTQYAVFGYIDAKDRNQLSQSAKWVTERISREVREALPQSVRTNVSGNISCVEFMNIVNASTYLDLPQSGNVSSFHAVKFDLNFTPTIVVAVMPIDANSIYSGVGAGTLGGVTGIANLGNQVLISLNGPVTFSRRSPQNRFYLLSRPISFCLNDSNGQLTRYDSYPITLAQAMPPASGNASLIADNFSANGNVFNYLPGTLSRAGLLQMNFRLQNRNRSLGANEEAFEVFHEVHIRNVP